MLLLLLDLIGIAYWLSGVKLSITSSSTVVSSSFSSFLTGLVEPLHLRANLISDPISGQNLIWKMSTFKIGLCSNLFAANLCVLGQLSDVPAKLEERYQNSHHAACYQDYEHATHVGQTQFTRGATAS
jgi:hypothetical protein